MYGVRLVRTHRVCGTNGAGKSVQGNIGTHTQTGAVQMEQAEMYRLHWYAHTEGCCTNGAGRSVQVTLVRTGYIGTHTEGCCTNGAGRSVQVTLVRTQRGAVQMEPAEVYRVSAWTREAKNGEGADKAHGEESCVTSRLFLVFQTGQS